MKKTEKVTKTITLEMSQEDFNDLRDTLGWRIDKTEGKA